MNKVLALSALAIAASVSSNAFAQSNDTNETTQIEPIIVSAGISPVAADEYGRSYTVITRRDIEERGYATVQQALEAQPGISVNGSGPNDRQIRIRGGEANHTLVLVDGMRVDAGSTAGYNLRSFDTSLVERIEIIRGPQSVPFGSAASAGVVNVITRQSLDGLGYGASAEIGEGDKQSFYFTNKGSSGQFSFTVSNLNDDGFDVSGSDGEQDGTRSESLTSKGSLSFNSQIETGYSARLSEYSVDRDDFDPEAESSDAYVIDDPNSTDLIFERAGGIYAEIDTISGSVVHRLSYDRASNQSSATDDQQTQLWKYRLQLALDGEVAVSSDKLLSLIAERKKDEESSSSNERVNESIAFEYAGNHAQRIGLQVGGRYDHSDQFDDAISWNAALSYEASDSVRLYGSAGQAVVYPTYLEIYGGEFNLDFGDLTYFGDSNLEPEINTGFDLGIEFLAVSFFDSVSVTYFNETLQDEIIADYREGTFFEYDYRNATEDSDRQGVEVSSSFHIIKSIEANLSYTYIDSNSADGETETRRPEHELGAWVSYQFADIPLNLSGNIRYVRGLDDTEGYGLGNREELPSFKTVDLSAEYDLNRHLALTARLTNAFDEEYQEVLGFATRGRAGYVGVRASW